MAKLKKADFRPARKRIDALPADRRERIEADAIATLEAVHLGEIRKALSITQAELSERTGVPQGDISRFERAELVATKISTLERYVRGLGGSLQIEASFPDGTVAHIPLRNGQPVRSRVEASNDEDHAAEARA